jgi:hypothetical protein
MYFCNRYYGAEELADVERSRQITDHLKEPEPVAEAP